MKNENQRLINFFKEVNLYDEEAFKYIDEHKKEISINNLYNYKMNKTEEDAIRLNGIFYETNYNKLKSFKLMVPKITDENTFLINIHEYAHSIEMYNNLNKKIKENNTSEVLPISLERIYVEKTNNKRLINNFNKKHLNLLEGKLSEEHLIGLIFQFEVLKVYSEIGTIIIPNEVIIKDKDEAINSAKLKILYKD